MSPTAAFYQAVHSTGRGLAATFNFLAGNTSLRKHGLKRTEDQSMWWAVAGASIAGVGFIPLMLCLHPLGALVGVPLLLAGLAEMVLLPAQAQAAYMIGEQQVAKRRQNEQKAQRHQAMQ